MTTYYITFACGTGDHESCGAVLLCGCSCHDDLARDLADDTAEHVERDLGGRR